MIAWPWSTLGCVAVAGMRDRTLQDGDTALIVAARDGEAEAVALLLDRGADLEAKDNVRARTLTIERYCSLSW